MTRRISGLMSIVATLIGCDAFFSRPVGGLYQPCSVDGRCKSPYVCEEQVCVAAVNDAGGLHVDAAGDLRMDATGDLGRDAAGDLGRDATGDSGVRLDAVPEDLPARDGGPDLQPVYNAAGHDPGSGSCPEVPCTGFTYCDMATGECRPGCDDHAQCSVDMECDVALHSCVCRQDFHLCDESCVANGDPAHYGQSCAPCPGAPPGGQAVCTAGACGFACEVGHIMCGEACPVCPTDGVELSGCVGDACEAIRCVMGYVLEVGQYVAFGLDQLDRAHFTYRATGRGDALGYRYFDGTWHEPILDIVGIHSVSHMVLGSDNWPWIGFLESPTARLARWNGTTMQYFSVATDVGNRPALALGGTPALPRMAVRDYAPFGLTTATSSIMTAC